MSILEHKNLTAALGGLHDPKGKDPTPLDIAKNKATAYRIRMDDGAGVP